MGGWQASTPPSWRRKGELRVEEGVKKIVKTNFYLKEVGAVPGLRRRT
jgi:hypothetical protein